MVEHFAILAGKKTGEGLIALKFKLQRHLHGKSADLFGFVDVKTGAEA